MADKNIVGSVDITGGLTVNNNEVITEADKDIISQIEITYDEENDETIFTFPKGIIPIQFYSSAIEQEYLVFDYFNENIINRGKSNPIAAIIETYEENTKLRVKVQGDYVTDRELTDVISELLYIRIDSYIDVGNLPNFMSLYQPGTKLYRHKFNIKYNSNRTISFQVITYKRTKYSNGINQDFFIDVGENALVISKENDGDQWGFAPQSVSFYVVNTTLEAYQDSVDGTPRTISGITSITEAIIEL